MKQRTLSTTPRLPSNQAVAPEYDEPTLRDRFRPTNGLYTLKSGEGALPRSVAVIPDTTNSVHSVTRNNNVSDLYSVGSQRKKESGETSIPFVHGVELSGLKGEIVRFRSVFDDGALVNAIDEGMYLTSKNRLSALQPSSRILKMADGRLVPSLGVWKGWVTVKGVSQLGAFQVLNSNGAWALLLGKPLLEAFRAVHDYSKDTINLPQKKEWVTLENQFANRQGIAGELLACLTVDIKQLVDTLGDGIPSPSREVPHDNARNDLNAKKSTERTIKAPRIEEEVDEQYERKPYVEWNHLWLLDSVAGSNSTHPGAEQPDVSKTFEPTLLTRKTDPCNPARVEAILAEITIA